MNRTYVEELVKLMQENPDLPVLCKVDSEIVADDGYAWWLGKLSEKISPEIDEYSTKLGHEESLTMKSDDDYNYWFETTFDIDEYADIPDEEWDEFAKKKIDKVANWQKAIFISVVVGD